MGYLILEMITLVCFLHTVAANVQKKSTKYFNHHGSSNQSVDDFLISLILSKVFFFIITNFSYCHYLANGLSSVIFTTDFIQCFFPCTTIRYSIEFIEILCKDIVMKRDFI